MVQDRLFVWLKSGLEGIIRNLHNFCNVRFYTQFPINVCCYQRNVDKSEACRVDEEFFYCQMELLPIFKQRELILRFILSA